MSFTDFGEDIDNVELIDTLWNVNVNSATFAPAPPCELIDTLWNVNLDDNADDFEYFVN